MVTARSASRSWITDALFDALPELIPEAVFIEALANNVVDGVPAANGAGVTTKLTAVAPAATVRLPTLQVMILPARLPPPTHPVAVPLVNVAPAGNVSESMTFVASEGPLFWT